VGLAASVKLKFDVDPVLQPGEEEVFDVEVDGELLFSRHKEGRFPAYEEIHRALTRRAT